jgi:predicted transcriptional regulator
MNVAESNRKIADDVGVSHVSIKRYRDELEDKGEIEPQEKRVGKDGIEVTVENIGTTTPVVDPFQEWFDSHIARAMF